MANKKLTFPPEERIEIYDALIASDPEIERKGKTKPYTSHNGHMFSYLAKDGYMAIRLPKEELENFLEEYDTERDTQYGAVMKEYAKVPDSLFWDTKKMKRYLKKSFEYVKTLKPK